MSMAAASEDEEAIALALSFHRSPTRHTDLLRGDVPLPRGMTALLKLAGARQDEAGSTSEPWSSGNSRRLSARFFIEHLFFRHDADHFRVLGLGRDATLEQIKEHHRLLMRLLHPDRQAMGECWPETCATRVNLAYNTLRESASRQRYLASLKPLPQGQADLQANKVSPMTPSPRRASGVREAAWVLRLESLIRRNLPQWVLGGTAAVSLLLVLGVYVSNPQPQVDSNQQVSAEYEGTSVLEKARREAEQIDRLISAYVRGGREPVRQVQPRGLKYSEPSAEGPAQQQDPDAPPPQTLVDAEAGSEPVPARMPVASTPVVAKSPADTEHAFLEPRPESPSRAPAVPGAPLLSPAQMPVAATVVVASDQVVKPALPEKTAVVVVTAKPLVLEPEPTPEEVLQRLSEAYERGDLAVLVGFFDQNVRTDAGGWWEMRREYEAQIQSTELRSLRIDQLTWSIEGNLIKGQGRYRLAQLRKGESSLRTRTGSIQFELVRRSNRLLLNAMFYEKGRS